MGSRRVVIAVLALTLWGATPARVDAAPLKSAIAQLLQASEKNTPTAIAATREKYEALKKLRPSDTKIDYAFGVALLHQKRYKDGLPLVARYVASHPADEGPQRTYIWALLQNRQYTEALTVGARLSECFSEPGAETNANDLGATAHYLGQTFGFLDHIRTGAIEPEVKSQRTSEILARLGKKYLPDFNAGRQEVADHFKQLEQQRQDKLQQKADLAEEHQQKLQDALESGQDEAEASLEKIGSTQSQLQDSARELTLLQHQLASLRQDRARLTGQIALAQAQLSQLLATNLTTNFSDQRYDPNLPTIQSTQITQTQDYGRRFLAQPWLQQLSQLNRQAFSMDRQLMSLQARAVQLGGKTEQQSAVIGDNEKQLRNAERRAKMLEKQVRQLEHKKSEKTAALPAKMTSLSTYIPFPFDEEKARILGWFAK